MTDLPKNFPEFSLMYKILDKKICELKINLDELTDPTQRKKTQDQIEKYQKEAIRIKSLFPDNFFDSV